MKNEASEKDSALTKLKLFLQRCKLVLTCDVGGQTKAKVEVLIEKVNFQQKVAWKSSFLSYRSFEYSFCFKMNYDFRTVHSQLFSTLQSRVVYFYWIVEHMTVNIQHDYSWVSIISTVRLSFQACNFEIVLYV